MAWFFGLGITGVALLALSLVFDGVLDGAFDGVLDGALDGYLSLPVVAGFLAATGFGGVLATELLDAGPVVATSSPSPAGTRPGCRSATFSAPTATAYKCVPGPK